MARRDKGLCFKCDKKFSIGHRCKSKELRVLLAHDDEVLELDEMSNEEINGAGSTEAVEGTVELSINTVVGFTTPETMKVRGQIAGRDVVVLIDCSATHNFLSQKLVEEL